MLKPRFVFPLPSLLLNFSFVMIKNAKPHGDNDKIAIAFN